MANNIQWVSLVNRNFTDIKQSLLNRLSSVLPEVTDTSSSNVFMVIIDMLAGLVEKLNYYIDHTARETFVSTARLEKSMYRKAYEFGYRVRASIPASSVIQISYLNSDDDIAPAPSNIIINLGTRVTSTSGIVYITSETVSINQGYPTVTVPVKQYEVQSNVSVGETDGSNFQQLPLPSNYVDGSCTLMVAGDSYILVEQFRELPTEAVQKSFVIGIINNKPSIILGDDYYAIKPASGLNVKATFKNTLGSAGSVEANSLTDLDVSGIIIPGGGSLEATNPNKSLRGLDIENIDDLRRNIPLHVRTGDRAVTQQDFIDIATMAPGVLKADGEYTCEEGAKIYIAPRGGGVADITLIDSTKLYVDIRAVIGTTSTIKAAGETQLVISADVDGRYLMNQQDIYDQIVSALVTKYNQIQSAINDSVHLSDVIALIDNQPMVDYLKLTYMTVQPFLRPRDTDQTFEGWVKVINGSVSTPWSITAVDTSTQEFKVYENGIYRETVAVDVDTIVQGSGSTILIYIEPTFIALNDGDTWDFQTYPYNDDIDIVDYSIPVILEENIQLNIITH